MPITVELQPIMQYSFWILLLIILSALFVGLIVLGILLIIWFKKKPGQSKKPQKVKEDPPAVIRPKESTKDKYCREIDKIERKYKENKIDSREAHQRLSIVARKFVHELTGVKAQYCTLEEIRRLGIPKLEGIIAACYAPEFSEDKKGDILTTLYNARKVIKEWN